MKQIETLVDDVNKILLDGLGRPLDNRDEEPYTTFVTSCAEALEAVLKGVNQKERRTLRMSNIGLPDRKLWYAINGEGKEAFPPNMAMKFFIGHIMEAAIIALVKLSGHEVKDEQMAINVGGVDGHLDCTIDGVLTDVKSASQHSYTNKFENKGVLFKDDFGYIAQLSGYSKGTGNDRTAFLPINKVTGEFCIVEIPKENHIDMDDRVNKVKAFLNEPTPPVRKCHEPVVEKNGNVKLNYSCKYCDHKVECWKECNEGKGLRIYKYSDGPQFYSHVEKEPRVEEITEEFKANQVKMCKTETSTTGLPV